MFRGGEECERERERGKEMRKEKRTDLYHGPLGFWGIIHVFALRCAHNAFSLSLSPAAGGRPGNVAVLRRSFRVGVRAARSFTISGIISGSRKP